MARFVNFLKIVRSNWKKSVFGVAAFTYGVSYGIDSYKIEQIMRESCEKAVVYGDQPIPANIKPQNVTVILNPVAKKRKAKKLFEEYCEPLLHLGGYAVTIIQTQSENQARNLVANLNTSSDIIIVAGGDGTLSDVVTGIMRKYKNDSSAVKKCSIGILPLGQTNKVADSIFYGYKNFEEVRKLVDATLAILIGKTKLLDVVQVELLEKSAESSSEPIYAVGSVEWGAWNDAYSRMDKYWYWGTLKKYVTYIFSGFKSDINWDCNGIIKYSDPCSGCSKCYEQVNTTEKRRWWHAFIPQAKNFSTNGIDYSKIMNENCEVVHEIPICATELHIKTQNIYKTKSNSKPSVKIELGPENIKYTDFVVEGWKRLQGYKTLVEEMLEAKDIEIHPAQSQSFANKERIFYIDNEQFELKPVKVKLVPNAIKVFCPGV